MRTWCDFLNGLRSKGRVRRFTFASCGALLLLLGACGGAGKADRAEEATGGSAESGGVAQAGAADDDSGGTSSGGTGGSRAGTGGGANGGRTQGGGSNSGGGLEIGGSSTGGEHPSGGSGGHPTGGIGGGQNGGKGSFETGGSSTDGDNPGGGSNPAGGGGSPAGGSGGDQSGAGGGPETGGSNSGGGGARATGGIGGRQSGGSGGFETGGHGTDGGQNGGTGSGAAGACNDPGTAHSGGTEYCENSVGTLDNGYSRYFWTNGAGSPCMTVFSDEATFKCDWTDAVDFLAGVGLAYDATRTPDEIGSFSSDFAVTGSGTGRVYVGIYGYTDNPWVEYYIIEDWVNEPDGSPPALGMSEGTISVDDGTYTVYQETTGDGIEPLRRYSSIRTEPRRCGHISISEHFSQWAEKDMPMGQLVKLMLLVEGMDHGNGSYEFTKATVTVQ